ncbi:MAG: phenylalanine--tRNA ligase subunit beta [Bacteroidales bacterium]|jgi:phenylalanyl-tRNA synthetase beta chain|nr:phenylalanine--tRNA ligase subunit beta [Bacteroidales bacterium]
MQVSYRWLKEYIQTDLKPEEISKILTSIGLEVDSLDEWCPVKGGLEGFVIGEVLTCEKHPNADKLSVTTVNVGTSCPLGIVCGAPNVAAGQKVVVATIGTTIYTDEGNFEIKKSKIRGVESEGMICAEDEMGLGQSHDGIMVLDAAAVPGTLAKDYFKIETDYIFEIGLTPNRIDAASHIGVARDLAAYLEVNVPEFSKKERYQIPSIDHFSIDNKHLPVEIVVENAEACPRYCGLTISGVQVAPSPEWLQVRLRSIGISPINNVVDITNFVLHEMCQPLHAFDADKIKGNKVVVKTLPEGTPFVTLDGVKRKLAADDLMICDAEKGMCIGGVFGGLDSGITDGTVNVFLESAYFNPRFIRRTAKRHGLNTDASFRFERGIDPNNTVYALKRAALLIREIAGGKISSDVVDVYPDPIGPFPVELKYKRINRLIGHEIAPDIIKNIMEALDIPIESRTTYGMEIKVPPYRVDVQREADVVEEILRIYGYNNVDFSDELHSTLSYSQKPERERIVNITGDFLSSCGFNEIMSNSLTKMSYYQDSEMFKATQSVTILNPLSQDLGCMRQTLLYGGLEAIIYNSNRRNPDLKLYEFGNCYFKEPAHPGQPLAGYTEQHHLALFVTGNKMDGNWNTPVQASTFYTLKAYAENIFKRLGIHLSALKMDEIDSNEIFSEGLVYSEKSDVVLEMGVVHQKLLKQFDIKTPVYYADFRWDTVLRLLNGLKITYVDLPRFPEVRRDLSLLVDKKIRFAEIQDVARRAERKLLKNTSLFDVYEGEKIAEGKKSYAVAFTLQDMEQTLTDKQIDKAMQRIVQALEKETGAQVRQ